MLKHTESRWTKVELRVYRTQGTEATWAVVYRRQAGRVASERLLAHGVIPCPPGSAASRDALVALGLSLLAAGGDMVATPLAPPPGATGGPVQDELPLDSAGTL